MTDLSVEGRGLAGISEMELRPVHMELLEAATFVLDALLERVPYEQTAEEGAFTLVGAAEDSEKTVSGRKTGSASVHA